MNTLLAPIAFIGRQGLRTLRALGQSGYLALGAVRALRRTGIWGPMLLSQMASVGVASVPIAMVIAGFTGVVLAIQASYTFTGTVPLYFVGALVGKTIIIELGPVLTGLALSGRVGANIAAEIGSMRVTEQIDALESLGYDPIAYLVVPRVIAGILMFPVVVALAIAVGIFGGWVTSLSMLDLSTPQFVRGLRLFFEPWDVQFALIKSATFGLSVTGIGAFFGFTTSGGAQGVGRATTRAVVVASVAILALDAFWAATLL